MTAREAIYQIASRAVECRLQMKSDSHLFKTSALNSLQPLGYMCEELLVIHIGNNPTIGRPTL